MADPSETNAPTESAATNSPTAAIPAVDVQAQIDRELLKRDAENKAQFKELFGYETVQELKEAQLAEQGKTQELLDNKIAELAAATQRFQGSQINAALLSAASDAMDAPTVVSLLAGQSKCDENGLVSVNGQSPADAVAALLKDKPFLAKAQGDAGSGSPAVTDAVSVNNPFSKEQFNLTEQSRLARENPQLATTLKAQAAN